METKAMLVDNAALETAKKNIDDLAGKFAAAGEGFIGTLTATLSTFSGETKDMLMQHKIGATGSDVDGTLAKFVEKQIPDLIRSLSNLLEENRKTIDDSDRKLAEAISSNGGN